MSIPSPRDAPQDALPTEVTAEPAKKGKKPKRHAERVVRKVAVPKSDLLDRLARASGQLYTQALVTYWRILRKTGNGKNGRKPVFLSQYRMEALYPKDPDGLLHSHTCDAIVGNFYDAIKSANERKKKGDKDAKYPRRRKWYYKITWKTSGIRLKDGHLILSTGKHIESLVLPWTHELPRMVEIGWKMTGGYELRAMYEVGKGQPLGNGVAAIDQGELRTATVYDGEKATIYSGRLVRSKARYRAKTIAKLEAKISRTRKGNGHQKSSRRRKKLIRAKRRVTSKINHQIKDIQHKQSAHLVSTLYNSGVQTVVIGDIKDIRKSIQYGPKTNQQLHGWSFGAFRWMVTYKAKRLGMSVELMDEAYTSQTCPQCAARHKPRGRTYRCKCGFVSDRDAVGSMNIRAKYLDSFGKPVVGVMSPPVRGVRYDPQFSRHLALNTPRTPGFSHGETHAGGGVRAHPTWHRP